MQQHKISELTRADLALFLYRRVVRQAATTGIPHLVGDTLFAAILPME